MSGARLNGDAPSRLRGGVCPHILRASARLLKSSFCPPSVDAPIQAPYRAGWFALPGPKIGQAVPAAVNIVVFSGTRECVKQAAPISSITQY